MLAHTEFPLLDPTVCWQAIYSRDQRFDGRFFAAATTTGLYCRNVCPVPFAHPKNIVLFACAAAAEAAGFRPCKRCQPQAAPGTPAWLGTSAVVSRAFRLILEGALNDGNVEQLAERLGLGARQLRRLFVKHLGASPLKIASIERLHLARNLIEESQVPITDIAFYSGFKSIREFNHAVRTSTGQSPTELRRAVHSLQASVQIPAAQSGLKLRLPYRKPFHWTGLLAFLKSRAIPGIELVSETCYQRTISIGDARGYFIATQDKAEAQLIIHLKMDSYQGLSQTVERIRRIFDLGADPLHIARHLSLDATLRPIVSQCPGMRVPGAWDGFETAVLAVLGETLSRPAPVRLLARLVQKFGTAIETGISGLNYLFPQPEVLAAADLSAIGISSVAAETLRHLTAPLNRKQFRVATAKALAEAVSNVAAVPGINDSTANYIAMRAFSEPDAFPAKNLGLRSTLSAAESHVSESQVIARAEAWRPWRAYAAMHLLRDQP